MGMFAAVSNDTQHALAIMLEDENFVDTYVEENNRLVFEFVKSILRGTSFVKFQCYVFEFELIVIEPPARLGQTFT